MELVFAIAAGLLVFGFVGYQTWKSSKSEPVTKSGGRTQSKSPQREVEKKVERKSKSTRSAKPRKSTPRKAAPKKSTAKKAAPKKSTAKKSTGRSKNVKSKG